MMMEQKTTDDQKVQKLTREFLKSRLSAAGVSYVVTSRSKYRRNLWSVVLLVTAGVMSYMTFKVVKEYLRYPKTVFKEDTIETSLAFPAVTVCHLNPISARNLQNTTLAKLNRLKKLLLDSTTESTNAEIRQKCYDHPMCHWLWFSEECECVSSPCYAGSCVRENENNCSCLLNVCSYDDKLLEGACHTVNVKGGEDQCWCKADFKYLRAGTSRNDTGSLQSLKGDDELRDLITLIRKSDAPDLKDIEEDLMPTYSDIYNHGSLFSGFVLSCSFEGKSCNLENFTLFFSPRYGKCYIFNYSGDKNKYQQKPVEIHSYGSSSGLYLLLRTEEAEVAPLLTRDTGVRVAIHNSQELPFVSENGFDIRIGDATAVEVRHSKIKRLGPPWGSCVKDGSDLPFKYKENPYNQLGCQKKCRLHYTEKACNCIKRSFLRGNIVGNKPIRNRSYCSSKNETQLKCLQGVLEDIERNKINCNCFPPCEEEEYKISSSTSTINKEFFDIVKGVMTLKIQDNKTKRADALSSDDILGLKVYYKTLQVEYTEEVPSYSWETLVSNIGGNMGFFMGLSVVTFVEVFEFLWDVLISVLNWNGSTTEDRMENRSMDDVYPFQPDGSDITQELRILRPKSVTLSLRTTGHFDSAKSDRVTSSHQYDLNTSPRERKSPSGLYGQRHPASRRRRKLFKGRKILKKKQTSISSSMLYSE